MTARIAGFDSREALGLARPRSVSRRITPERGGCAAHYGGPAQRLTGGHEQCRKRWREWQAYHMGPQRGWSDIAYTGGFCDHGFALAGRGFGVRTAANGVNSANDGFYAFCWLGGEGESPTRAALDAFEWWVREAREHGRAGPVVKAHQEFKQTACAGGALSAYARTLSGRPIEGAADQQQSPPPPAGGAQQTTDAGVEMVLVICPGKPLCLLTRGRLWALQTNAQADAYSAAGVPRRTITGEQWDALASASEHLRGAGA